MFKQLKNKKGVALINVMMVMIVLMAFGSLFLSMSYYFLKTSRDKATSLSSEYEAKSVSESIAQFVMSGKEFELPDSSGAISKVTIMQALNEVKASVSASVPNIDPDDDRPYEERLNEALDSRVKLSGVIDGNSQKQYTVSMSADGLSISIQVSIRAKGVTTRLNSRIKIMPDGWSNDQFQDNMEKIFSTASSTYIYDRSNLCRGWIKDENGNDTGVECGFCYSYRRYNGEDLAHADIPHHLHISATAGGGTYAKPLDPICVSLAPMGNATSVSGKKLANADSMKFFKETSPGSGKYVVDRTVFGVGSVNPEQQYFNEGAYIALDYPGGLGSAADAKIFADFIINGSCQIYSGEVKSGTSGNNGKVYSSPTVASMDRNLYVNGDCAVFGINIGNYSYVNGNFAVIDAFINGNGYSQDTGAVSHNLNSDLTRVNGSLYLGAMSDYESYRPQSQRIPERYGGEIWSYRGHPIAHGNLFVRDHLYIEGMTITDEYHNTYMRYVGGDAKILGSYVDGGVTAGYPTGGGADIDAFKQGGMLFCGSWNIHGNLYSENVRWYTQWDSLPLGSWSNNADRSLRGQNNYYLNVGGNAEMRDCHVMAKVLEVGGSFTCENTGFEMIMWQGDWYPGALGIGAAGGGYTRVQTSVTAGGDVTMNNPTTLRMNHIYSGGNVLIDFTGSPKNEVGYGDDLIERRRAFLRHCDTGVRTPNLQAAGDIEIYGQIDYKINDFYVEYGAVCGGDFIVSGDKDIRGVTDYKAWMDAKLSDQNTNPVYMQDKLNGSHSGWYVDYPNAVYDPAYGPQVGGISVNGDLDEGVKAGGNIVMYQYTSNNSGGLKSAGGGVYLGAVMTPGAGGAGPSGGGWHESWNTSSATNIFGIECPSGDFYARYVRINVTRKVEAKNVVVRDFQIGDRDNEGWGGFIGGIYCNTLRIENSRSEVMKFNSAQLYPRFGDIYVANDPAVSSSPDMGNAVFKNTYMSLFLSSDSAQPYYNPTGEIWVTAPSGGTANLTLDDINTSGSWLGSVKIKGNIKIKDCSKVVFNDLQAVGNITIQNTPFASYHDIIAGGSISFEGVQKDIGGGNIKGTPFCGAGTVSNLKAGGSIFIENAINYSSDISWTMGRFASIVSNDTLTIRSSDNMRAYSISVKKDVTFTKCRFDSGDSKTETMTVGGNFTFDNTGLGTNVSNDPQIGLASLWSVRSATIGGNLTLKYVNMDYFRDTGAEERHSYRIAVGGNLTWDNSGNSQRMNLWKRGKWYIKGNAVFKNLDLHANGNMSGMDNNGFGPWFVSQLFLIQSGAIAFESCAYPGTVEENYLPYKLVARDGSWNYIRMYVSGHNMNGTEQGKFDWHRAHWDGNTSVDSMLGAAVNADYSALSNVNADCAYVFIGKSVSYSVAIDFNFINNITWGAGWGDEEAMSDHVNPYVDAEGNIVKDPAAIRDAYADVVEFEDRFTRNASDSSIRRKDNNAIPDTKYLRDNIYTNATLFYFTDNTDFIIRSNMTVVLEWLKPSEVSVPGINSTIKITDENGYIQQSTKTTQGTDAAWMTDTSSHNITIFASGTFPWFSEDDHTLPWNFDNIYSVRFDTTSGDLHIVVPAGMVWNVASGCHFDVVGAGRVFIYMQTGFRLNVRKTTSHEALFGARSIPAMSGNDKTYLCFNNNDFKAGSDAVQWPKALPNSEFNQLKPVQIFLVGIKGANDIKLSFTDSIVDAYIYMPYAKNSSVTINCTTADGRFNLYGAVVAANIVFKGRATAYKSDVPADLSGLDFSIITGLPTGVGNNDSSFNGISVGWEYQGFTD